jgi:hypothetical protein
MERVQYLVEGHCGDKRRTARDEDSLQVGFANHDTRSMRSVDFSGCLFIVGERVLLAQREDEEFFECEDTGRRWGRPETPKPF